MESIVVHTLLNAFMKAVCDSADHIMWNESNFIDKLNL